MIETPAGGDEGLAALLREVVAAVGVPVVGVISDDQHSIRKAVATVLPEVPHQLCHFHFPREAALPIFEADRYAKKELKKALKKAVRGVRPIERAVERRRDAEADLVRGYRPGLFHASDVAGLPRTNNALEQLSAPSATTSAAPPDAGRPRPERRCADRSGSWPASAPGLVS